MDDHNHLNRIDTSKTAGARRYRKRVLAVRAMAGETAWLDGRILWRDGRVVWEVHTAAGLGSLVPDASLIALAQRRLAQVAAHPRASRFALGDASAWLARRISRLAIAKRLAGVHEDDLPTLIERAVRHDAAALERLARLLPAEAHCLNGLPGSPAAALVAAGSRAVPLLHTVIAGPDELPAALALAAMCLGAIYKRAGSEARSTASFPDEWQARAYNWAVREGMPDDPPLVVGLLAAPEGPDAAKLYIEQADRTGRFMPSSETLRTLLDREVSPQTVARLVQASMKMERITQKIARYRDALPERSAHWRREAAEAIQAERTKTLNSLVDLVQRYALTTADPATINDIVRFTEAMLSMGLYADPLGEAIILALRRGLQLPLDLQPDYLHLLATHQKHLWERQAYQDILKTTPRNLQGWVTDRHGTIVSRVAQLLEECRDPAIVGQSITNGQLWVLLGRKWKDPQMYHWAIQVMSDIPRCNFYGELLNAAESFASTTAARTALNPLIQALKHIPADHRPYIAHVVVGHLPPNPSRNPDKIQRLTLYVPRIVAFCVRNSIESRSDNHYIWSRYLWVLTDAAVMLDEMLGDAAMIWFDWLSNQVVAAAPEEVLDWERAHSLGKVIPLVPLLAKGDFDLFNNIVRMALAHRFAHNDEFILESAKVLKHYASLCKALARILPLQPHRSLDLVVKIGLVARLGKDASAPLGYLEEHASPAIGSLPEEWQRLVQIAPGAINDALDYTRARTISGESTALPPGVRKALDRKDALARELAFLETKLAAEPHRKDIATRVENLRARLSMDDKLQRETQIEVTERLAQVTAEAQIAAAEIKTKECYRLRLRALAGELPSDMPMSDDLVNATLLLSDIRSNRRLLTRLLRAYVRGDTRWHEKHPANVRYLEKLSSGGVDVDVWLGVNPRKYLCKHVPGGRVRLVMERDPLRVLQMGNYFDTCLSFGRINSFSTVANACELNKRVIFAYDSMGRVVGRKLIGLTADNKLIGFYTYSTLSEEDGKELRAIFGRYCTDLAARCRVERADDGTIPTLFAGDWYDDGAVAWSDNEARPAGSTAHMLLSPRENPA